MIGIGSAIGAGLQLVSGIIGQKKASDAMKNVKSNIEKQQQENKNWYNRVYNENATQRADAQALLARTEESIKQRNRQAAGTQAVMGGSEDSVAAAKAENNQALSDTTSKIAAMGDARKDAIEQRYQENNANLQQQLNQMEIGKAQEIASATKAAGKTGAQIGQTIDDYIDERNAYKQQQKDSNRNNI